MDVPSARKDITQLSNVRWLVRNIPFRNSMHPNFREALDLLRKEDPAPFGE
jgi:hypothetical protein